MTRPHWAATFVASSVTKGATQKTVIQGSVLSDPLAEALRLALHRDAQGYLYSSLVSLGDALRGVASGYSTWPTVKLYYSVFYSMRAHLALADWCVFYAGSGNKRTPYLLRARAGESPTVGKGTTHKLVIDLFQKKITRSPIASQPIAGVSGPNWLMELRERANYKDYKFVEPETSPALEQIRARGLRKAVAQYILPENSYLAFDAAHAAVALPLLSLVGCANEFRRQGITPFMERDAEALTKLVVDERGSPLSLLIDAVSNPP